MRFSILSTLALVSSLAASFARGDDDAISQKAIAAIKKATVYIRSEGTEAKSKDIAVSGSGFIVKKDADGVLIVTNLHVIEPKFEIDVAQRITQPVGPPPGVARPTPPTVGRPIPGRPTPGRPTPPRPIGPQPTFPRPGQQTVVTRVVWRSLVLSLKNMNVTVVFDSGNPNEKTAKAEVVAMDPENDLAILRVKGLTDVAEPLTCDKLPELIETTRVYTFGFPFGKSLAADGANPNITVGQASISSLRNDADGELAVVQLDGGINPGNTGGPVVNAAGQLVGIAVKGGNGIGIAIPATQLAKTMNGRVGAITLTKPAGDGPVGVEVGLVDPLNKIKSVTLHYLPAGKMSEKERKEIKTLAGRDGAKSLELTLEKQQLASGNLTLDPPQGEVLLEAVYVADDGKEQRSKVVSKSPQAVKGK